MGVRMEAIGKAIIKLLSIIIAITVLAVAVILLYAKTKSDFKIPYREEDEITVSENMIVNVDETVVETEEEIPVKVEDAQIPARIPVETAYPAILDRYPLKARNLTFDKETEIQGNTYYKFLLSDAGGNLWDDALLYNIYNGYCYLYDKAGNLRTISENSFSTINSYAQSGSTNVSDDAWDEVVDKYLTAMLHDKNKSQMAALTDTAYYYDSKHFSSEKVEDIEATLRKEEKEGLQTAEDIKFRLQSYGITDYAVGFFVNQKSEQKDELGAPWVDLSVGVITTYKHGGEWINEYVGDMRISLRKYSNGWKVFWIEV